MDTDKPKCPVNEYRECVGDLESCRARSLVIDQSKVLPKENFDEFVAGTEALVTTGECPHLHENLEFFKKIEPKGS